jgi:hypothetical protein
VTPRPNRRRIEELDALLEGRLAPEDASASSRRLAAMATTVVDRDPFPAAELGPERKTAIRQQLLADIAALPAPVTERAREALLPRMRRATNQARVAVASTMAASMVGTAGVAVAAQEALPGDALYGVKKATESLRLSLAGDQVAEGRLELRLAQERLAEVIAGSQDQRVPSADALIDTLGEMDVRSLSGAEHLIRVGERDDRPELFEEVADFTERQAATLAEAYDGMPSDVKPHAEDSLSVLRRIRIELLIPAIERCDCVELAGSSSPLPAGPEADELPWFRSAALPLPSLDGSDQTEATEGSGPGSTPDAVDDPTGTIGTGSSGTSSLGGTIDDVVDGTTGTVGRVTESTTDTLEETVDGTTSTVTGTVKGTTDTVERTVDGTTDAVEGSLEGDAEGAVDELGDAADEVVDGLGNTVEHTTEGLKDTTRSSLP